MHSSLTEVVDLFCGAGSSNEAKRSAEGGGVVCSEGFWEAVKEESASLVAASLGDSAVTGLDAAGGCCCCCWGCYMGGRSL